MLEEIKKKFIEGGYWGLAASIDLHNCDRELIRDARKIKEFTRKLCDFIKMKPYGECVVVNFGKDPRVTGFSMTQFIETSLISAHFANQTNNVYLDIFSCQYFDPQAAAEFAKEFFQAQDYNLHYIFRK